MGKRLVTLLLAGIIIVSLNITAFAGPLDDMRDPLNRKISSTGVNLEDVISGIHIGETERCLMNITSPDGNKNTFKKFYYICGKADQPGVEVILALYDSYTDSYKEYTTTEGTSRWEIGSSGLLSREIFLKEGVNSLKIIAYKKSDIDMLEPGVNLQVNYFTITVRDEALKDLIIKSIVDITEKIKTLFDKK